MSVTPGSVRRVLNISLCKQRNSSLTQRCASCGIRNLIFDVDRAGRAAGKISSGEEARVSLLAYLSSIVRSELMEERRGEMRRGEVVVNLQMIAGDAHW